MTDDGRQFAIATALLSGRQEVLAWSSLGCWAHASQHADACRELALLHGRAAGLTAGDHVLDLGCGHGASLALWPEVFAVGAVSALEWQADCVAAIRAAAPAALRAVHHARFDRLPLPPGLADQVDHVLCVDAAYHADSLDDFLAVAAAALKDGGSLAFSTLLQAEALAQLPAWRQRLLQRLLALAGIPAASIVSLAALRAALARQGFEEVAIRHLDADVLGGFADFVLRRRQELGWRQRLSPGWAKIELTAAFCRHLQRGGELHYSLIRARRRKAESA